MEMIHRLATRALTLYGRADEGFAGANGPHTLREEPEAYRRAASGDTALV